jgi:hypothetical protein
MPHSAARAYHSALLVSVLLIIEGYTELARPANAPQDIGLLLLGVIHDRLSIGLRLPNRDGGSRDKVTRRGSRQLVCLIFIPRFNYIKLRI